MMIEGKEISYEDLLKLYNDKCKYCNTLEERLQKANKRNDYVEERINLVFKKAKNLKDKYKELYEFAENLCNVINEKDKDIEMLIKVNNELTEVNKQYENKMKAKIKSDIALMFYSSEDLI